MLKIPVCYSFDAPVLPVFQSDQYVCVGCGGYSSPNMAFSDNTGCNISEYNKYINEFTLIYWMAKNYSMFGNPDFIGLAHYRRYLDYQEKDVNHQNLICSFEDQPVSLYQTYCLYHVKSDIDLFMSVFSNMFPFYQRQLTEYFQQRRHAKCNMFIMSRELFFEYFKFMEPCIDICLNSMLKFLDLDRRDRYQRRALGFILERMTGFWIYMKSKHDTVNVVNAKIVEEDINSIYARV